MRPIKPVNLVRRKEKYQVKTVQIIMIMFLRGIHA